MTGHHLAQLNVGTLRHPLDDPRTHGFTSMLDTLNEVADRAPGFVWRLVGDGGNDATAVRTSLGADVIVNMSVWDSRDSLWNYVYRSGHLDVLRRRAEWFELPKTAFQVMWWIPAGHVPSVEEAVERLELLRAHGPSPSAFGFRDEYTPADGVLCRRRGEPSDGFDNEWIATRSVRSSSCERALSPMPPWGKCPSSRQVSA